MGFNKIFWGLLFMFDLRLQGFDILPDAVGYFIIFFALEELILKNHHFKKAKLPSLILAIFSIADIVSFKTEVSMGNFVPGVWLVTIVSIFMAVLNLVMIYHICYGIAEMAQEKEALELEENAIKRWKFYLYTSIGITVFIYLSLLLRDVAVILFIPMFILTIVNLALMMGLMKQAEEVFGSSEN